MDRSEVIWSYGLYLKSKVMLALVGPLTLISIALLRRLEIVRPPNNLFSCLRDRGRCLFLCCSGGPCQPYSLLRYCFLAGTAAFSEESCSVGWNDLASHLASACFVIGFGIGHLLPEVWGRRVLLRLTSSSKLSFNCWILSFDLLKLCSSEVYDFKHCAGQQHGLWER